MDMYDIMYEALQQRVDNGELTLEEAEIVNALAYEKYIGESVEDDDVVFTDEEIEECFNYLDDGDLTMEEALEGLSASEIWDLAYEAALTDTVDSIKGKVKDGVDSVKSKLPNKERDEAEKIAALKAEAKERKMKIVKIIGLAMAVIAISVVVAKVVDDATTMPRVKAAKTRIKGLMKEANANQKKIDTYIKNGDADSLKDCNNNFVDMFDEVFKILETECSFVSREGSKADVARMNRIMKQATALRESGKGTVDYKKKAIAPKKHETSDVAGNKKRYAEIVNGILKKVPVGGR